MSDRIKISLRTVDERSTVSLVSQGEEWFRCWPPFRVCFLEGEECDGGYGSVKEESGGFVAVGSITGTDGTNVEVSDTWRTVDAGTVQIDREIRVITAGKSRGWRVEFCSETAVSEVCGLDDWEFCVPGALYNKNDTDHDGVEDYLGTYTQDYRDDRLPSLAVLAFLPGRRRYFAIGRCSRPRYDTSLSREQILARNFVQATDIGSLGLSPLEGKSLQIGLRASYPFSERASFCLNTNRDGWAAYIENQDRARFRVAYQLTTGAEESLTEAIWAVTKRQMKVLGTSPERPNFSLQDSVDYRLSMTQHYYRKWDKAENPKEPAGYMVHFSPRSGKTQGTLLEYGFCGAQMLLAYTSIRYGYSKQMPLWIDRARSVIDFFVDHCQLENGFSQGIYDAAKQDFVYWFTGILLPFQYSDDETTLRRFLGSQITKALAPIAQELRSIKGNYTRTMCESMYPILLAYKAERQHGYPRDRWLAAGERFGAFLLRTQADDGSWFRGYDSAGNGLMSPSAWFGSSDTERKSGTIFPIQVLVELYGITGNASYLEAAEKAGSFIVRTYVDPVEYVGGLNDTTHIKSVKIDSVGVMFAMRSLIKLYETAQNRVYLDGAVKAAKVLASWVYLWNVPFPQDSLLGSSNFKSTGWAVCDVIPAGSYLDNELLEFTGDLIRIAQRSRDRELFKVAEIVEYGMQQAVSTPQSMLGYVFPGIQCEGIMTAYWMSDPDVTEFSGAANKVKGQDNDTCNGLINGQAAYGLFDLYDKFRTTDLDTIWRHIFIE
jgi:hypothetical protein